MRRLDELISELCPDGVRFVQFSEIAEYVRGITYSKYDECADGIPVLRANNITLDDNTLNFADVKHVNSSVKIRETQYLHKNDILICAGSGSKEHVGKVAFIFTDINCICGGFMAVVRVKNPELLPRFVFHCLTSQRFRDYLRSNIHASTINNLNTEVISGFTFPVPPIEIQQEIVRILDKFSSANNELIALLAREHELRKKQYRYYLDEFMTFGDDIQRVRLIDVVSKLTDGMHILPDGLLSSGKYPVISAKNVTGGDIVMTSDKYAYEDIYMKENARTQVQDGDVLLTIVGTIGRTAIVSGGNKMLFQRSVCIMTPERDKITSGFLRYWLDSTEIQSWMKQNAHGGAQKGLYLYQVKDIPVPLPSLEEQHRIASILDRFNTMCTSLTQGLPAEIQARKKQYAYYRDKLLTFRRKDT